MYRTQNRPSHQASLVSESLAPLPAEAEQIVVQRAEALRTRLLSYLDTYLPPDTAGTQALVLATLVARLELPLARSLTGRDRGTAPADASLAAHETETALLLQHLRARLDRDILLLPVFVEEQRAVASNDDLPDLVLRFLRGERPTLPPVSLPEAGKPMVGSAASLSPHETALRLRELQGWGVDLALSEAMLALTPTQRVQQMVRLLTLLYNTPGSAFAPRAVRTA